MNIECPSCYSNNIKSLGNIPQIVDITKANSTDASLVKSYVKCHKCNLYFIYPRPDKEELLNYYRDTSLESWQYDLKDRKDWQEALMWINNNNVKGSILDIGCFDGKFLENLKGDFELFGIEINKDAANKAVTKGINIIKRDVYDIDSLSRSFSVVSAFDIIEHVEDPLNFIGSLCNLTIQNGYIIISSGNTEAPSWKICRRKYWYLTIPGHISFINMKWCNYVATRFGLSIEYVKRFSHSKKSNPILFLMDASKNIIYSNFPESYTSLKRLKNRFLNKNLFAKKSFNPPSWETSRDHLIIIFKKKH